MQPRVSVVVPTYNRCASLQRLLLSLANQTLQAKGFEVLVVDDGSSDRTPEVLRALTVPYSLRSLRQTNQGPGAARNLGVKEARGELIVFLDDDTVPMADLLEQHLRVHDSNPDAVVIGPMVAPPRWERPAWVRWEEEILDTQYKAMLAGEFECTPRQFYTANASLSRVRFLAAGGFDSTFKRAEDVEMAYRMRDQGAYFIFHAEAVVHHYAERTFAAWCSTPYQYGRYDVVMHREKGHEALPCAAHEFHSRHPLTRALARSCVGRPLRVRTAVGLLRAVTVAADALGARGVARLTLSGIFNLLYWQGASDEFGGPRPVWRTVAEWAVPA
jgi:glycosyltransferase involved in cell wall biosynthesis